MLNKAVGEGFAMRKTLWCRGVWGVAVIYETEAYLGPKPMGFLNGMKLEGYDPWPYLG